MLAQALTAFNQNALRSALLALATFRGLSAFGWSTETVVGISTILVTAPFFLFSILAGRLADIRPKAALIRWIKAVEIPLYGLGALGLLTTNLPLLLTVLLFTGIATTLLGPAKFGILPEIVARESLMRANSWMSATNTVAILVGLIVGSLMMDALPYLAALGCGVAVLGWLVSRGIRDDGEAAPAESHGTLWQDHLRVFERLKLLPAVAVPVLGCSWFWFQGALNTTILPLLVANLTDRPSEALSLLFIVTTVGVVVGALGARFLRMSAAHPAILLAVFVAIALLAVDVGLASPLTGQAGLVRLAVDLFVISIGTGFYLVPLTTALQVLAPAGERARFIGINHTLNGLAMMLAGVAVLLFNALQVSTTQLLVGICVVTSVVAAWSLTATLSATARQQPAG
ncbi:MAG TPA: MFS transporter [Devosia sp.]